MRCSPRIRDLQEEPRGTGVGWCDRADIVGRLRAGGYGGCKAIYHQHDGPRPTLHRRHKPLVGHDGNHAPDRGPGNTRNRPELLFRDVLRGVLRKVLESLEKRFTHFGRAFCPEAGISRLGAFYGYFWTSRFHLNGSAEFNLTKERRRTAHALLKKPPQETPTSGRRAPGGSPEMAVS